MKVHAYLLISKSVLIAYCEVRDFIWNYTSKVKYSS